MDELVKYLYDKAPDNIIIGEDDCNLLIFGDGSCTPTDVKMLLLVVGCDKSITDDTICELRDKYRDDNIFKSLFDSGEKMATIAKIPFVMVGYKKCSIDEINDEYIESMQFMARKICPAGENEHPTIYGSNDFVKYIYKLMGLNCSDSGTNKQKNKSLADVFHVWSRSKLSSRLVKQDFDAIFRDHDHFAMIEVKRSPTISIESWSPFRNDIRNYDIQNQFSKIINAPFYTFHYNGGDCKDSTKVGCYKISGVNIKDRYRWMNYKKTIISADEIIDVLKQKAD